MVDQYEAIVNLSIAFEALLALPHSEKTDRLVDSISLLLGRIPRLSDWARQFYDTRSKIVHEGSTSQLRYIIGEGASRSSRSEYQPLLIYGRQIFRLCLGTLLLGAGLAEQAGLEEKLVSNQERYEKICKAMDDETISAQDQLISIANVVDAIDRYRFIPENINLATALGAVRRSAKALLACDQSLTTEQSSALQNLVDARRDENHLSELDTLQGLSEAFPEENSPEDTRCRAVVRKLVNIVAMSTFQHYYWIKNQT